MRSTECPSSYYCSALLIYICNFSLTSSDFELRPACHTCCMRICNGSTTSQNVSTTNWESQCIAVCSTTLLSIPGRLLYTSLRHSQPTSSTISNSASTDRIPHYRLSTFGRRAFSVAGPTVSVTRRSPATA